MEIGDVQTRIGGEFPEIPIGDTALNVKARMKLVFHISEINDKSDPQTRPPTEGRQWTTSRNITSRVMDNSELEFWMAFFEEVMITEFSEETLIP